MPCYAMLCYASKERADDCEVVQYVTGMTRAGGALTLAYGVNDCEQRLFNVSVDGVRADLTPVNGSSGRANSAVPVPAAATPAGGRTAGL